MIHLISFQDGEVKINRDEVNTITEFAVLAKRPTSMEGDADGRKKKLNLLELLYVRYMADGRLSKGSIYAAFEDKERSRKIKEDIGLPRDWKPDAFVKNAIRKYIEIMEYYLPSVKVLNSLERGLMTSARSIDYTVEQVNELYNTIDEMKRELKADAALSRDEKVIALSGINDTLNSINSTIINLLKMSASIPNVLETVKNLQASVWEQEEKGRALKGNKTKGNREDPR